MSKRRKAMKMTKGMKIFWVFIAVGLVFSMIMLVSDVNPYLFRNYQYEKEFDEKYLDATAEVIFSLVPGSTADELKNAIEGGEKENMIVVSSMDYSLLPDDSTQFPHYVPYYATITMVPLKDGFPINNAYAEFYNDELAVMTYRLNTYSSREDNGRKSLWRQQQIMNSLSESLVSAGYKKASDIKYYVAESSVNVNGAGFGYIEKDNEIYDKAAYRNFYGGYVNFVDYYDESNNMISVYLSPDEENVIAVVPMDLFGDEECLYSSFAHRDDRYAEVYVISYNKEIFEEIKNSDKDTVNYYSSADSIENFILMDKMGVEKFCNMYER